MKKSLLVTHTACAPRCNFFVTRSLLLTLLMAASFQISFAQVSLVKDIATGNSNDPDAFRQMKIHHSDGNLYFQFYEQIWKSDGTPEGTVSIAEFDAIQYMVSSGPFVYFTASRFDQETQIDTGMELWRTDGTAEGTILLKDIYPGEQSGNIFSLVDVNGTLFFTARNPTNGQELWKSDGTPAGTIMVKDILRVSGHSNPRYLVALNGKLYFSANDGTNGYELWTSDGTAAGTVMVKDINPAVKSSSAPEELVNVNGTLYFTANDGTNGKQLWKSTGAIGDATLVTVINPGGNSAITRLAKMGDRVFFMANDGIHGNELWASNGTSSGTYMVKDLTPGPGSATAYATPHISFINEAYGKIYFLAVAKDYTDLWTSDGTEAGTVQITFENNPGFPWRHFGVIEYKGLAYFGGSNYDENFNFNLQLWKTDGTAAGTSMAYDNLGDGYSTEPNFTVYKDRIYMTARGELSAADGTPDGIEVIKRFGEQLGSNPANLTDVNGKLYFSAGGYYATLYHTDGTEAGTVSTERYFSNISNITNVNGTVFFSAADYTGNNELYKSDGTPGGTVMVTDLTNDESGWNQSSDPHNLTAYNGKVYFAAKSPFHGSHLYVSDGTAEGTKTVSNKEYHEQPFANPDQLTVAGDNLYFTAVSAWGRELFVYDGVTEPRLTRDIKLHYQGSTPINLIAFKGNLYFQADNRGNGYELWKSDGTASGTVIVKDIRRDDLGSGETLAPIDLSNMVAATDVFYFAAIKPTGVNALWKSDGTANGTRPVIDFAGAPGATMIGANGNTIVYSLTYNDRYELWSSNGTAAGTTMLMRSDNAHSEANMTSANGVYYINTFNYTTGLTQVFRTDGTPEGTYEIHYDGHAQTLGAAGGKVYLSMSHEVYGWELFLINDDGATGRVAATDADDTEITAETDNEVEFSTYPNPFVSEFSVRVTGEENQLFQMKVLNMNGDEVAQRALPYNTEHVFGQGWKDGMYILQIMIGEKTITRRIFKNR